MKMGFADQSLHRLNILPQSRDMTPGVYLGDHLEKRFLVAKYHTKKNNCQKLFIMNGSKYQQEINVFHAKYVK